MSKFSVILLSLFLAFSIDAGAQIFSNKVKQENQALKIELEALRCERDSLKDALAVANKAIDSLAVSYNVQDEVVDVDSFESCDSLVKLWYVSNSSVHVKEFDMETERFSSNVPDSVFIARLDAMNSAIPLSFNNVIKNYCILYSEKMPSSMGNILGLSQYYYPIFDEVFTHYNLPLELKALVIVESMMKPEATSRVGAKGLWQFMYGTSKGYGMYIDSWIDERMDPVKSTIGAARYLRDAYNIFKDWSLAIASYNCGAGSINKAIRRSGGKRGFWEIYDYLPRETRNYIPAFIGALYAIHYYKEYGIEPKADVIEVPVDTMLIRRNLHFKQIESVLGIEYSTLKQLNAQYYQDVVPGQFRDCVLRIPMEYSNAFIDAGDSLYTKDFDKYFTLVDNKAMPKEAPNPVPGSAIIYKVKSGDNLGYIARRYGVTVSQIKKWNSLTSNTIRIGQKLKIYSRR